MPLYDYTCQKCGFEFEMTRPMSEASLPATCPVDGGEAKRAFGNVPMTFIQRRGPLAPGAVEPGGSSWSHHGHSHGPGAGSHSH
ncbi:MAG: zinc ribbon domain-containing protein [Fimbriimonadaceae bacterium]|nr:zinc ribbon domain-containing protein [Fimbriimonadaceae bacterium]MCZ2110063.1 zinc ribbon domain-containing protein [Dehalococcoidia bacterium]